MTHVANKLSLLNRNFLTKRHDGLMFVDRRPFYGWLIQVFNRDEKRVEEIGPDRAAAEWIVRNGGSVKFTTSHSLLSSFVSIPMSREPKLMEIHARGVPLSNNGMEHLAGLKELRYLDINSCGYISELSMLEEVAESLQYLDIGNCTGISDISPVVKLKNLQTLIVTQTLGGEKRTAVLESLEHYLTKCEIID